MSKGEVRIGVLRFASISQHSRIIIGVGTLVPSDVVSLVYIRE